MRHHLCAAFILATISQSLATNPVALHLCVHWVKICVLTQAVSRWSGVRGGMGSADMQVGFHSYVCVHVFKNLLIICVGLSFWFFMSVIVIFNWCCFRCYDFPGVYTNPMMIHSFLLPSAVLLESSSVGYMSVILAIWLTIEMEFIPFFEEKEWEREREKISSCFWMKSFEFFFDEKKWMYVFAFGEGGGKFDDFAVDVDGHTILILILRFVCHWNTFSSQQITSLRSSTNVAAYGLGVAWSLVGDWTACWSVFCARRHTYIHTHTRIVHTLSMHAYKWFDIYMYSYVHSYTHQRIWRPCPALSVISTLNAKAAAAGTVLGSSITHTQTHTWKDIHARTHTHTYRSGSGFAELRRVGSVENLQEQRKGNRKGGNMQTAPEELSLVRRSFHPLSLCLSVTFLPFLTPCLRISAYPWALPKKTQFLSALYHVYSIPW